MKLLKLIPDNTNIKFLRWRVPFYAVSVLLMAVSLSLVFTKGLNFGVDFIGGQMVRMTFVESSSATSATASRSSSSSASRTRSRSG